MIAAVLRRLQLCKNLELALLVETVIPRMAHSHWQRAGAHGQNSKEYLCPTYPLS